MVKIAPSMLAADFLRLGEGVELVNKYADMFHLDVMDGIFVPNISYGFPVIDAISAVAQKPMDAHLMIMNPEHYVERFAKDGIAMISFHLNATEKPGEVIELIHKNGAKAGIAINPDIPVEKLYPYLKSVDYIVLMSVYAGYGGQKFIEETHERLRTLKSEIDRQGVDVQIEIDGGVSAANSRILVEEGASILVAGSAVFKSDDPVAVISAMRG